MLQQTSLKKISMVFCDDAMAPTIGATHAIASTANDNQWLRLRRL